MWNRVKILTTAANVDSFIHPLQRLVPDKFILHLLGTVLLVFQEHLLYPAH